MTVAGCLLGVAALTVATALLVGSLVLTSSAAVLSLLCGAAATRIVMNELAQSRREAARDRAAQARSYSQVARERSLEHSRLAATMTRQVSERDAEIGRLVGTHVQRLATIAHGDGICTTHIPGPVRRAGNKNTPARPVPDIPRTTPERERTPA